MAGLRVKLVPERQKKGDHFRGVAITSKASPRNVLDVVMVLCTLV